MSGLVFFALIFALFCYVVALMISAAAAWSEAERPIRDGAARLRLLMSASAAPQRSDAARIRDIMANCRDDPARFGWSVLGRDGAKAYWSRQREICRSVVDVHTTVVPAGNAVGKSYVASGIALWALYRYPGTLVFTSAPSQTQLNEVLWKEMRRAHANARIPLGGKFVGGSPIKLDCGEGWQAIGHVSNTVERMSGHHAKHLFAIVDEASGAPEAVYEAVNSLSPSRLLLIGNPLRPEGRFFELCQRAEQGSPTIRMIRVPSTESPDIGLERSPRGMADMGFLATNREAYGENSLWWLSHVLALFPGQSDDTLILREWLDLAGRTIHVPAGPRRLSIDLAVGNGQGDLTVLMVRDDNGVLWMEWSRSWSFEEAARRAKLLVDKYGIKPAHVTYDAGGIGADFGNRLAVAGVPNATPYLGGKQGPRFANLRTASAWAARLRLDPNHTVRVPGRQILTFQAPFAIPPEFLAHLRGQLEGLRYAHDNLGRVALENREDWMERLRCSPDFADVFCQSFAFPG